jgi:hypothetical protein
MSWFAITTRKEMIRAIPPKIVSHPVSHPVSQPATNSHGTVDIKLFAIKN